MRCRYSLFAVLVVALVMPSGARSGESEIRARTSFPAVSGFRDARSVDSIAGRLSGALDFAEGNFGGESATSLTGHVFFVGDGHRLFGVAAGQARLGAREGQHLALEAAVTGDKASFYAVLGGRFRDGGDTGFGVFGVRMPLADGMRLDFGGEYEPSTGRREINVAVGPPEPSARGWDPFFAAGGSRGKAHAVAGIRIYLGPPPRSGWRAPEAFAAVPNAAAGEINALFDGGGDTDSADSSETSSGPPASAPPGNGLALGGAGSPPGLGGGNGGNGGNGTGGGPPAGVGAGVGAGGGGNRGAGPGGGPPAHARAP